MVATVATGALVVGLLAIAVSRQDREPDTPTYPLREDITTTVFWVGEAADSSNAYIHNRASTWRENWMSDYGGFDNPKERCDFMPCEFTPNENPFYFALPYNDLDGTCKAKESQRQIPWYENGVPRGQSLVKNRWIEVRYEGKVAYAQWQDAGPFGEDDTAYVFGGTTPQADAGLDISPSTASYLGLGGRGQTDWRFVTEDAVPPGPWRKVVTSTPPDCAEQSS
jgi:hypothetical protein